MLLEIKNLTKEYKRNGQSFAALDDINLTVDKGQLISIVGCSGSGKSTLLSVIAGLLNPTAGEVVIDGKAIIGLSDSEISYIRGTKIGYIPQGQSLLSNLSVLDNVCLPGNFTNSEENVEERASELLSKLGIDALAHSYPGSLSGGERRRAVIARALINRPKLILADEPTSDLDRDNTKEVIEIFRSIADEGTTVLMATHESDTESYSDIVYELNNGILSKLHGNK
ncbi:MAG: ABC transporter ATP-binding protein [Clostridia bacterium]|nr:ABC transporter ATP-binding protein [Clostridia bacterium]